MKQELDKCIEELTGIDAVLTKLEGKDNVSVFEQLCSNCNELFKRFCTFDVKEIVALGLGKEALDFLYRFKSYIVRLSKYKQMLIAYKEMQISGQSPNNIVSIEERTRKLELTNEQGSAA